MRVRTEANKTRILEIAGEAFRELGYRQTSMEEIAARLGGSKATLYGYFDSKEQLFVESVLHLVIGNRQPLLDFFGSVDGLDVAEVLTRFGELILVDVMSPRAVAARRMIIAETVQSDIGARYWNGGPQPNLDAISRYLSKATRAGKLNIKNCDIAALHLAGLYQSELVFRLMYRLQKSFTRRQIRLATERAVGVFMAAYGPSSTNLKTTEGKRSTSAE